MVPYAPLKPLFSQIFLLVIDTLRLNAINIEAMLRLPTGVDAILSKLIIRDQRALVPKFSVCQQS